MKIRRIVNKQTIRSVVMLLIAAILLAACGGEDVSTMYTVENEQEAQQGTKNVELSINDAYGEAELKKVIIDQSSKYNHDKVNGIRFNILYDGKQYAEAKIAFNDTGINATGVKKKNIAEINMK